ncbi:carboxymuconolactone decarboxylase family protein [Salininema proteolyticum]|uniref:Carboxymuconolactone decarboxylase family protein n=1 Tax=Salininema proteolyticum TaxID=1607685 RepID=A0ABV8TZU4_9ACTN
MQPEARMDFYATSTGKAAVGALVNVAGTIAKASGFDEGLAFLAMIRASQINGCSVCVDMHVKDAALAGETPVRLAMIAAWKEANCFTDAERAVLAVTEEATRLADAYEGVSDETWAEARAHFSDEELAAIISQIALINAFNRINAVVHNPGGDYVAGSLKH